MSIADDFPGLVVEAREGVMEVRDNRVGAEGGSQEGRVIEVDGWAVPFSRDLPLVVAGKSGLQLAAPRCRAVARLISIAADYRAGEIDDATARSRIEEAKGQM